MLMHGHGAKPGQAGISLQGGVSGVDVFFANPNTRAFYELSVTFADGTKGVNFPEYEQKSFALFRARVASMGVGAAGMQDHLKLIPGQVRAIVAEDPTALKDCNSFREAMGPP